MPATAGEELAAFVARAEEYLTSFVQNNYFVEDLYRTRVNIEIKKKIS